MPATILETIMSAYPYYKNDLQMLSQDFNGTTLYIINSSICLLDCFEKMINTYQYQSPAVIFEQICLLINILDSIEITNLELNIKVLQYAIKNSLHYSINSNESINLYGGCKEQFDEIKNEEEKQLALQVFSL